MYFRRLGLASAAAFATATCEAPPPLPGNYRLVHASVLFRHGARAPIHLDKPGSEAAVYDDWSDALRSTPLRLTDLHGGQAPTSVVDARQQSIVLPGGCRCGELTLGGFAQAQHLGRELRAMYGGGLSESRLSVRSTNVSRCVLTARGVLEGLLGPAVASQVAIRTVASAEEDLTPNPKRCLRLAELWKEARAEWSKLTPEQQHPLAAPTLARLQETMPAAAIDEYGLREGRWVPLKDVLCSIAAQPSGCGKLPFGIPMAGAAPGTLTAIDLLAAAQVGYMVTPSSHLTAWTENMPHMCEQMSQHCGQGPSHPHAHATTHTCNTERMYQHARDRTRMSHRTHVGRWGT